MESSTQDDNLMAALAHLAVILPFWGIVAAIVIWATQKDKSKFVGAHAVQAIGWQVLMIVLWFAGMVVYVSSFVLMIGSMAITGGARSDAAPAAILIPFGVMGLLGLVALVVVIVGLVAAYHAFQGRPYWYPFIGRHLDRFDQQPGAEA